MILPTNYFLHNITVEPNSRTWMPLKSSVVIFQASKLCNLNDLYSLNNLNNLSGLNDLDSLISSKFLLNLMV
jgi:hypothetical protein